MKLPGHPIKRRSRHRFLGDSGAAGEAAAGGNGVSASDDATFKDNSSEDGINMDDFVENKLGVLETLCSEMNSMRSIGEMLDNFSILVNHLGSLTKIADDAQNTKRNSEEAMIKTKALIFFYNKQFEPCLVFLNKRLKGINPVPGHDAKSKEKKKSKSMKVLQWIKDVCDIAGNLISGNVFKVISGIITITEKIKNGENGVQYFYLMVDGKSIEVDKLLKGMHKLYDDIKQKKMIFAEICEIAKTTGDHMEELAAISAAFKTTLAKLSYYGVSWTHTTWRENTKEEMQIQLHKDAQSGIRNVNNAVSALRLEVHSLNRVVNCLKDITTYRKGRGRSLSVESNPRISVSSMPRSQTTRERYNGC